MKTSKIITTIVALNFVMFMSVSSFANSVTGITGDDGNTSVKNQSEVEKNSNFDLAPTTVSENEFSHLRFNVNDFNTESESEELPVYAMDYLRFDSNNFSEGNTSELNELPEMNQFDYLRFDVTTFTSTSDISELPVIEFDYLHFNVVKFSNENSVTFDELPGNL